jgi:phage terminase large subunit-like protein
MSAAERREALSSLSDAEISGLEFDWDYWGRPAQKPPPGDDWTTWLIKAGRGFGKTRAGAEWVRSLMCGSTPLTGGRCRHVALVAETAADARKVMLGDGLGLGEGSGILQVHSNDFRPTYNPSLKRVTWPNGAIATLYNATEPEELRGPAHGAAWCDELAKWRYAQDTWDNLQFGLRLGVNPRVCITTTPKPIKLLKDIIADPGTRVTRGSTLDNAGNLPPKFLATILRKYAGTRLGRQEIDAELLDDVVGALWSRSTIEGLRVKPADVPQLIRIVVAIDPAATSGEDSDETGIICAGIGVNRHGYILEDASGVLKPYFKDELGRPCGWAAEAVALLKGRRGDRIIAEINNGGEMVESTIRVVDENTPYRGIHASRGKAIRAEPVSALYEQGRVHHVGMFAKLEDQMCAFTPDFDRNKNESPDRMDAAVWALTDLMIDAGEGMGLLEYYRQQAEKLTAGEPGKPNFGFQIGATAAAGGKVQLKAPPGISQVYGMSGHAYMVAGDGTITVSKDDAKPLYGQGFTEVIAAVS